MAQGAPRVPFSPPRWIQGDSVLFAATGMVVASLSPISAGVLRDPDGYAFRASYQSVIFALFFGTLLALLVLTARSVLAALGCALIGGPLVGALTGAAGSICFWVTRESEVSILASTLRSIPLGALLGVALACAGSLSATFGRRPAHDDFDRLLVALGIWLIAIYAFAAHALDVRGLAPMAWTGAALGIAALGVGLARKRGRVSWFERVRAGTTPEWTLRDWNQVPEIEGLVPLFGASALACDAVLVHVASARGSAYRSRAVETMVLLAPGPGRRV